MAFGEFHMPVSPPSSESFLSRLVSRLPSLPLLCVFAVIMLLLRSLSTGQMFLRTALLTTPSLHPQAALRILSGSTSQMLTTDTGLELDSETA